MWKVLGCAAFLTEEELEFVRKYDSCWSCLECAVPYRRLQLAEQERNYGDDKSTDSKVDEENK